MSIEENKRVARRFCELFTANDIAGALELLSEDSTYWILGRREVIPSAGPHSKAGIARIFDNMMARLEDGMRLTALSMIAEGDKVAIEAQSYGPLKNGRVYNNHYHMLMRIRDGKIAQVREYLDTQHVLATWYG